MQRRFRIVRRTSMGTLFWDNVRKVWTDNPKQASHYRSYPLDLPEGVGWRGDFLPVPVRAAAPRPRA